MTSDPIDKLATPDISDPIHDYVELIISGNGLSLTYHLNNLIAMATSPFVSGGGFNTISTITNNFSGDWSTLQKSADAIRNLTEYNRAYRESIDAAMLNVEKSWQGNAAESARSYFSALTTAIDNQIDPMTKVADEIKAYALAAYGMANGIADAVQTLGDCALQWLLTQIAAAKAAATGVGAGIAAGLQAIAAGLVLIMTSKIASILSSIGHLVNAAEALTGVIAAGVSAATEASEIPALPASSYDHPGVS
ncbi:hypothetical protein IU433_16370 [Nocardia puris]|uniref:hypothetical protein n=1 Tax=Nocardia puris TaxID=208602 RepID=UPI0018940216|nr:hypothetical protein [Nocardia puris]MBF6211744.1 hypothetical protein [Nocardia puris]MBF6365747.1 hypothetical protein [Nocardia puris]MBF6460610.1 hypothetical protein [Nocardia puris]